MYLRNYNIYEYIKIYKIWLLIPAVILFIIVFGLLYLSEGELNVTSYWQIQKNLFVDLNHLASRYNFWSNITLLGDGGIIFMLFIPLLIKFPQYWAAMLGAVPISSVFSVLGKQILAIPRPAAVLDPDSFNIIGATLTAHNSLPSGHSITSSMAIFSILAVLIITTKSKFNLLWLLAGILLAILAAFSRVAVGAHWPLDSLTGLAIGCITGISGAILVQLYSGWWGFLRQPKWLGIVAVLIYIWSAFILNRALSEKHIVLWIAVVFGLSTASWLAYKYLVFIKTTKLI